MDFPQLGGLEIRGLSSGEEVSPEASFLVRPEGTGVHHLLAEETLEEIVGLVIGVHDVESCLTQRLAEEGVVEAGYHSTESAQHGIKTDHLIVVVEPKL